MIIGFSVKFRASFTFVSINLILACLLLCCKQRNTDQSEKDIITLWYGNSQKFGHIGNPQKQINLLGNIKLDSQFTDLQVYYTLNEKPEKHVLTLGCDLHRLAEDGDFNIEIYRNELKSGKNIVNITVEDPGKILGQEKVEVNYTSNKTWPLPYSIIWDEVENIQDVAEIIDGQWELVEDGVRTKIKYYDRVLGFGDTSWINYEVSTSVIFHSCTKPRPGPPTYNVAHAAIASRWPGHDTDSLQPNRKWYPLGATSEFRVTDNFDSCSWRIFDGENIYQVQDTSQYRTIIPEKKYFMKHRVISVSEKKTLYSVKLWRADKPEPKQWDFQANEISDKKESGSACLIAHHTDVTFGDVYVKSVTKSTVE